MAGGWQDRPKRRGTTSEEPKASRRRDPMPAKIIVSYDGTANEDDAVALGRVFADAGADVSLAYVTPHRGLGRRHAGDPQPRPAAARQPQRRHPRRHRPLDPRGPGRARRARAGRRDRVLLGLAHREGPRLDRQLRAAPARGRPHRRRDRARRLRRDEPAGHARGGRRRRRRRRPRERRGARRRARRRGRAGRRRGHRPARARLARRRARGPRLAELLRGTPGRNRHGARCSCCRGARACSSAARSASTRPPSGAQAAKRARP